MKRVFLLLAMTGMIFTSYAQVLEEAEPAAPAQEETSLDQDTVIQVEEAIIMDDELNGDDEVVIDQDVVSEVDDTVRVKIGKKGLTVIEKDGKTTIEWDDLDVDFDEDFDEDNWDFDKDNDSGKKKFDAHWASFRIGLNNYVNSDMSMSLDPTIGYMDLNTGRSWNYVINFMEHGFRLGSDYVGLVTGMGLEISNYHFDKGNNIYENAAGNIEEYDITVTKPNASVDKSKLKTTYLTVPALLEFQVPMGKEKFYISGGVIGGVKIGSKTKMVYTVNGDKQKDKVKDDFNLRSLRYGYTAQIGFDNISLYATYYPTSLFEDNKGPELYPFAIGISLINF